MFIVVYSNCKERNSLGLPGSRHQEGIKYVRHTYLFPLHEENRTLEESSDFDANRPE